DWGRGSRRALHRRRRAVHECALSPLWERALSAHPRILTGEGAPPHPFFVTAALGRPSPTEGRGRVRHRFGARQRREGYFFPPSRIPATIAMRTRSDRLFADILVIKLAR